MDSLHDSPCPRPLDPAITEADRARFDAEDREWLRSLPGFDEAEFVAEDDVESDPATWPSWCDEFRWVPDFPDGPTVQESTWAAREFAEEPSRPTADDVRALARRFAAFDLDVVCCLEVLAECFEAGTVDWLSTEVVRARHRKALRSTASTRWSDLDQLHHGAC